MANTITLDLATCHVREEYTVDTAGYARFTTPDRDEARARAAGYTTARITRRLVITTAAEDVTGEGTR